MSVGSSVLTSIPLFEGLTAAQLNKVAALCGTRDYDGGQTIFKEGDLGDEFFVLLDGRVRISKKIEGVGEEALSILEPGSYFGEMALVSDSPRSAEAIAHSSCLLAVLTRDQLDALMFTDKDLASTLLWTFVRTLAARLRETNDKIRTFFVLSGKF